MWTPGVLRREERPAICPAGEEPHEHQRVCALLVAALALAAPLTVVIVALIILLPLRPGRHPERVEASA